MNNIPEHVAIIMDGNGRWAAQRNLPRADGHKAGCETLEEITEACARAGIKYLTVYAFSTENWKRSKEEVSALMALFRVYMVKVIDIANNNNIRVRLIGDMSRLDEDIQLGVKKMTESTSANTGMTLTCAVNYGGRDEIRRAFTAMVSDGIKPEEITENVIASYLDTKDIPDPDLLIRTSGEQRISNFLLWQIAYSEIYITEKYWPDFHTDDLMLALDEYAGRDRRYGGRK